MPRMSVAKSLDRMPEAFVSDKHIARAVSREVKAGKLRKLASRLYTRNMADPPEAVVARNLWSIVAGYFRERSLPIVPRWRTLRRATGRSV